jgi:class 3 adenylate cyclase
MATKAAHRKLAAILSADVAGYSGLMGTDEEATIETLTAYRKVFISHIESHSGRVPCDGTLHVPWGASFLSAVGWHPIFVSNPA